MVIVELIKWYTTGRYKMVKDIFVTSGGGFGLTNKGVMKLFKNGSSKI